MYSLVPSRPTGYLIKYNLFTTISELSDLYTNGQGSLKILSGFVWRHETDSCFETVSNI